MKPKFGIKILQILQGQSVSFHFLISHLEPSRDFLFPFQKVFAPKYLAQNTMLTQHHY